MRGVLADDAIVRLLGLRTFPCDAVEDAVRAAADVLPEAARRALAGEGLRGLGEALLLEGQFGPRTASSSRRHGGCTRLRPLLPAGARALLRRRVVSREAAAGPLRWPVEERFVVFAEQVRAALEASGRSAPRRGGRTIVPAPWCSPTMSKGFSASPVCSTCSPWSRPAACARRSPSWAARTRVPDLLLHELRAAGFEVALHGWRHDGQLSSRAPASTAGCRR